MMAAIRVIDLVTTDEDKKFEPAGHMASAIIKITQEKGGCLPQDLNEIGFSPDDVIKYWDMAHSIASVEINLMKDKAKLTRDFFRRS